MAEAPEKTEDKVEETPEETVETTLRDDLKALMNPDEETPEAPEEAAKAEEETKSEEEAVTDEKETASEETKEETVEAPEHWAAEDREAFSGMTPESQGVLLAQSKRMESAHNERSMQSAEDRKFADLWKPLQDDMAPYSQQLALNGVDTPTYLRSLVAADKMLRETPVEAVRWIARRYNIDIGALTQTGDDELKDPQIVQLQQNQQQLATAFQQTQTNAQQAAINSANAQLQAFIDEKDESGTLTHPHFEKVEGQITGLMNAAQQSGKPIDLQTAYDQAVWVLPDTRDQVLKARDTEVAAKLEAKKKEDLKRAKSADTTVKETPTSEAKGEPKELRDELRQKLRASA